MAPSARMAESLNMDRNNPYEAAFENYLQQRGLCYVAIDETRRALLGETPIKNLDFIVLGANGGRLLLDIKGRRFPGGTASKPRYVWENWATHEDLDGLQNWRAVFGPNYLAMLVFLYRIGPNVELPADCADLWTFRDQQFLLRAVAVDDYLQNSRVRSPKWGTVALPTETFRKLARPFRYFTHELTFPTEVPSPYGPLSDWSIPEIDPTSLAASSDGGAALGSDGP